MSRNKTVIFLSTLFMLLSACQSGVSPTAEATSSATPTATNTPTLFPKELEGKLSIQTENQLYILDFDTYKLERLKGIQFRSYSHTLIWSHDGNKLLYLPSSENYQNLYVLDQVTGEKTLIVSYEGQETCMCGDYGGDSFSWSPNDEQIAFVYLQDENLEINTIKLEDNKISNITNNVAADVAPTWSPDGEKIAFLSDRSGSLHLYIMNADGSQPRQITPIGFPELKESIWRPYLRYPTWSPNGKKIAFISTNSSDQLELFVIDPDGNNLIQLTQNSDEFSFSFENNRVVWSPDSTKLLFYAISGLPSISNSEIYTVDVYTQEITRMTFDDDNDVSYDYHPLWINNGNVIIFISYGSPGKIQHDRLFGIDLLNDNKLILLYEFPFDVVYFAEVLP